MADRPHDDELCTICQAPLGAGAMALPCGHRFHASCLARLADNRGATTRRRPTTRRRGVLTTCPNCRSSSNLNAGELRTQVVFGVGARVEARYGTDSWYLGMVVAVLDDAYKISWEGSSAPRHLMVGNGASIIAADQVREPELLGIAAPVTTVAGHVPDHPRDAPRARTVAGPILEMRRVGDVSWRRFKTQSEAGRAFGIAQSEISHLVNNRSRAAGKSLMYEARLVRVDGLARVETTELPEPTRTIVGFVCQKGCGRSFGTARGRSKHERSCSCQDDAALARAEQDKEVAARASEQESWYGDDDDLIRIGGDTRERAIECEPPRCAARRFLRRHPPLVDPGVDHPPRLLDYYADGLAYVEELKEGVSKWEEQLARREEAARAEEAKLDALLAQPLE